MRCARFPGVTRCATVPGMSNRSRRQYQSTIPANNGVRIDARNQADPYVQAGARNIHRGMDGSVIGFVDPATNTRYGTKATTSLPARRQPVMPMTTTRPAPIMQDRPDGPAQPTAAAPRLATVRGTAPIQFATGVPPMDPVTAAYKAQADRRLTPAYRQPVMPKTAAPAPPYPAVQESKLTPQVAKGGAGDAPVVNGTRINRLTGKPMGWRPGDPEPAMAGPATRKPAAPFVSDPPPMLTPVGGAQSPAASPAKLAAPSANLRAVMDQVAAERVRDMAINPLPPAPAPAPAQPAVQPPPASQPPAAPADKPKTILDTAGSSVLSDDDLAEIKAAKAMARSGGAKVKQWKDRAADTFARVLTGTAPQPTAPDEWAPGKKFNPAG